MQFREQEMCIYNGIKKYARKYCQLMKKTTKTRDKIKQFFANPVKLDSIPLQNAHISDKLTVRLNSVDCKVLRRYILHFSQVSFTSLNFIQYYHFCESMLAVRENKWTLSQSHLLVHTQWKTNVDDITRQKKRENWIPFFRSLKCDCICATMMFHDFMLGMRVRLEFTFNLMANWNCFNYT